ncbi:MAG: hypothetical protein OHK0036_17290 [Bacteroidia bacterium]
MIRLIFFLLGINILTAQILPPNLASQQKEWKANPFSEKYFVENKGQWESKKIGNQSIIAAYDGQNEDYFFTKNAVQIELIKKKWRKEEEEEENKKHRKYEEEEQVLSEKRESIYGEWLNANPNVEILFLEKNSFYTSYSIRKNNEIKNINYIPTYNKILYKNIYPNIDIEYTLHPQKGYKYTIIVRPGGDISKVQFKYSKKSRLKNNQIFTSSKYGEIIDHSPLAFYEQSKSNQPVSCEYLLENNIISFKLGKYNPDETIIIDPWTQTPNFPSTNWDCVWECERDGAGNVYIIGGTSPMQLIKYNNAGALQWTYNTPYDTSNAWLGTFAVDNAGNSYVTKGSVGEIQKVNTTGSLVWNNTSPSPMNQPEFWNITFNCNQTKLVVAGTYLPFLATSPSPMIYNIDMNTGNVTSSVQVTGGGGITKPQEVRSITSCSNSTYYYLTHDSIGYVSDNLSPCGNNNNFPFHVSNGLSLSYKCENFRADNTGLEAIVFSNFNGFVYVNAGNQVQKRNFSNGAIVATAAIPGGSFSGGFGGNQVGNSGIAIDNCGNVYVGSTNGVYKFDPNLNPLGNYATTFNVYDVEVNSGGEIIACGSTGNSSSASRTGYVQTFAASACTPQSMICCDPNICPVPQKCQNDPPFTFSVSTPGGTFSASCGSCINSSTGSFSPSVAGTGTFVVTYSLSCGSQTTQVVVAPCATLNVCSQPSGSLQVSGGTPSYTWAYQTSSVNCSGCTIGCTFPPGCSVTVTYWANYATGTVAPAPPNYPIRITDATGSTIQINSAASITPCTSCPTIVITPTVQNALCNGGTGSASVSASGGTAPYTYTWMPGSLTGSVQSNLSPSTIYTITAKDNNGCTGTVTLSISQPSPMTTTFTTQNATCTASNGNCTVTVSGGTAPYSYTWNPTGGNSNIANNLSAGIYSVIIKDANNCTITATTSISASTVVINTSVNIQNASCSTPGSATVTPSGGTGPYNYTWIPTGGNNSVAVNLSIGNYTVNITDNYGCSTFTTLTVGGTGIAVTGTQTQSVTCYGGSNGSATVNVTGGTTPYSYTWSPSVSTSSTATNLSAGNYTVYIQDNASCTATTVVNITQPQNFTLSVNTNSVSCNGSANGSATINVSGGTPSYNYTWQPSGGNSNIATGLSAGIYTVNISDVNNCSTSTTVNITQPSALTVNITSTNTCGGNATATVNVSGGIPNYSYTWTPTGGNGQVASNLSPGTYTVLVSDNNGCLASSVFTVSSTNISYTISVDSVDCFGTSTGNATINVSGGVTPYTYTWLPSGGNNNIATGLSSGNYTVQVNDNAGCALTATLFIPQPNNIVLSTSPNTSVCVNNTITLSATASGGNGGYSYNWNPGGIVNNGTMQVSPSSITTYSVFATDSKGCTSNIYTIQVYIYPILSATGNTITICENTNVILTPTLTSTGNGGPYSYTWNTGATTSSISVTGNSATQPHNFTVTISDGCNAPVNAYFTVSVTPSPPSTFTADITKGCPPVHVNFTADYYNTSFTYSWNLGNGQTATGYSVSTTYSNTGYYDVSLTVSNGACSSSTTYTNYIQVYPYPIADFIANPWVTTEFEPTVSFTSTSQGAITYNWFFSDFGSGANNTSNLQNPVHTFSQAGTYSVALVVYNQYGCRDMVIKTIVVEPEFHIYIPNVFTPDGNNINDVFICKGMGIDVNNFEMMIFDRWGELIFKTTDFYEGWDGTVKGKKNKATQDVYVYKIKVYDLKGRKHEYVGHVTCLPSTNEF